jgi:hypothetical protein
LTEIALALRSELYNPKEILEFPKIADASSNVSNLFFPDIPGAQESLELCSASLAETRRIKIGSGVLRLLEHNPKVFSRRIATIQWMSGDRFVLGIGTGSPSNKPSETIERMFSALEEIKKGFPSKFNNQSITFPDVLVAALKTGIAVKSASHGEGLLLNFCSPAYSERLVSKVRNVRGNLKTLACYIKVFYSIDKSTAERLLAEEFAKYNSLPQYHTMFERDGIADAITSLRAGLSSKGPLTIPESLQKISLANPSYGELVELVNKFRNSGINLPCVYPYFSPTESSEFKKRVITEITTYA